MAVEMTEVECCLGLRQASYRIINGTKHTDRWFDSMQVSCCHNPSMRLYWCAFRRLIVSIGS